MRLLFAEQAGMLTLTLQSETDFESLMLSRVETWRGCHPGMQYIVDMPAGQKSGRDLQVILIDGSAKKDGR